MHALTVPCSRWAMKREIEKRTVGDLHLSALVGHARRIWMQAAPPKREMYTTPLHLQQTNRNVKHILLGALLMAANLILGCGEKRNYRGQSAVCLIDKPHPSSVHNAAAFLNSMLEKTVNRRQWLHLSGGPKNPTALFHWFHQKLLPKCLWNIIFHQV